MLKGKFDPNGVWGMSRELVIGDLDACIDLLFKRTSVDAWFSRENVRGNCLKYGYFAFDTYAIYFLPSVMGVASVDFYEEV